MTTGLAVVLMALGLVGTLRAVAIVTTGGEGRFPLDPLVSIVLGLGLILSAKRCSARSAITERRATRQVDRTRHQRGSVST